MKKRLVIHPDALPRVPPINTLLIWVVAVNAFDMHWVAVALGWAALVFLIVGRLGEMATEHKIDIFGNWRDGKQPDSFQAPPVRNPTEPPKEP